MIDFLHTAKKAAHSAAQILIENFGKIRTTDIVEKQQNDFLTFVDEQAEQRIMSIIRDTYPDHAILAEESGSDRFNSEYQWIIDPLDGTKNYISGIPVFSVSIALRYKQQILIGVILDPLRHELYHAVKDQGAFMNDMPIRISRQPELSKSLLATGFPFKYKQFLTPYMSCFTEIFNNISGMRRMGSAALDLAFVASGKFDGFWEIGLNPWDVAAGILLTREAGGTVSDFWGKEDYLGNEYMLATNGHIHQAMMMILKKHFENYQSILS